MIDNFAPQPYPLEASTDGNTWHLVIGWRQDPTGQLAPLVAWPSGGLSKLDDPSSQLRYRQASVQRALRDDAPSPAAVVSPAVRTRPARRPDPA